MDHVPLIKGIFINSHIESLRALKGDEAVHELQARIGKFDGFNALDDYPVRMEIEVLETVLDLLHYYVDPDERSFEAGRLHFRNFSQTAYGAMILGLAPKTSDGFRMLLLHAGAIARFVFHYTNFSAQELSAREVRIVMENNDYPIDHFRGLFYEWALMWGFPDARVEAEETAPRRYEYTIRW